MTGKLNHDDHNDIESQAIIYSNSKTNAEGSLLTMVTKVLEKTDKQNTFADSLTGGEGIERKTCTTAAITNYTKLYDVETEIVLNKTPLRRFMMAVFVNRLVPRLVDDKGIDPKSKILEQSSTS